MAERVPRVSMVALWSLLGVGGCGQPEPEQAAPPPDPPAEPSSCPTPTSLTWDNFASGYSATWCAPCHTSSLTGTERRGAPEGVNLDRWEDLQASLAMVQAFSTGEQAPMPPGGGVSAGDLALWAEYLDCGAPGAPAPAEPCAEPLAAPGDVELGDQAEADAFCSEDRTVGGDLLVTGPAVVDCLCEVEGDLHVDGSGVVSAGELHRVGGAVSITGAELVEVALPAMATVGGSVEAIGGVALQTVSLDSLSVVPGDLILQDDPVLAQLQIRRLVEVQGDLLVIDTSLAELGASDLTTVGGDLVLSRNLSLVRLTDVQALTFVGGSVVLEQLGVTELVGFDELQSTGGDIVVVDNPILVDIPDFSSVATVGGSLVIDRNAELVSISGFQLTEDVGADLLVASNRALEGVYGLDNLKTVGGGVSVVDNPSLGTMRGLAALQSAGGLEVRLNARLRRVPEMPALDTLTGPLRVVDNADLGALGPYPALTTIGGAVQVVNNPHLPSADVWLMMSDIGSDQIDGTVTIWNNEH